MQLILVMIVDEFYHWAAAFSYILLKMIFARGDMVAPLVAPPHQIYLSDWLRNFSAFYSFNFLS